MVIIPELKHNRFQEVSIPRPIELYKQYGLTKVVNHDRYSGDEFLSPDQSKVDIAASVAAEVKKMDAEKSED